MILRTASAFLIATLLPVAAMAEDAFESGLSGQHPNGQQSELVETDNSNVIGTAKGSRLKFRDRAVCLCADGLSEKDIRNSSRIPDNRKESQQQDQVSDEKH